MTKNLGNQYVIDTLQNCEKALAVLFTILTKAAPQGAMAADEIRGHIQNALHWARDFDRKEKELREALGLARRYAKCERECGGSSYRNGQRISCGCGFAEALPKIIAAHTNSVVGTDERGRRVYTQAETGMAGEIDYVDGLAAEAAAQKRAALEALSQVVMLKEENSRLRLML